MAFLCLSFALRRQLEFLGRVCCLYLSMPSLNRESKRNHRHCSPYTKRNDLYLIHQPRSKILSSRTASTGIYEAGLSLAHTKRNFLYTIWHWFKPWFGFLAKGVSLALATTAITV
mmetsp:Transcript_8671/g.20708  ORF Transcript_8671/g.20708 Transcript_8671/m.20708 type:complete len:115 (-) Transcript_8671:1733-2077(-)